MDNKILLNHLHQPKSLTTDHLEDLEEIIQKYPYFHLPHVLVAKLLEETGSSLASQKIRKAALQVFSRSLLKTFLYSSIATENKANMEETSTKNLFDSLQQEIDDFDKKMEVSSIEDLEKELIHITQSYTAKDYLKDQEIQEKTDIAEKTETQKEQNSLIDSFLNEGTPFKMQDIAEEIPLTDENQAISEISEEPASTVEQQIEASELKKMPLEQEISEEMAIEAFDAGDTDKAIEIYKYLKVRYPTQVDYFQSQIDIFEMDLNTISLPSSTVLKKDSPREEILPDNDPDTLQKAKTTQQVIEKPAEKEVADMVEISQAEPLIQPISENTETDTPAQDEDKFTESQALAFFSEGETEKAVEIYRQLMLQFPEKKAYFASQIEILES